MKLQRLVYNSKIGAMEWEDIPSEEELHKSGIQGILQSDGSVRPIPYNKIAISNSGDSDWSIPHMPYSSEDWDSYYSKKKRVCSPNHHKWVDTGMRKTFCKICDTAAYINPMTGYVEILPDLEEEEK